MGMVEKDFEARIQSLLNDPELFPGPRRVAVMKVIAEVKCEKKIKKIMKEDLTDEEKAKKADKCLKRALLATWWDFRLKNPVYAKGLLIVAAGNDIVIQKEETSP